MPVKVMSCRYCPFYCPDRELQRKGSEVYGHCCAMFPARPLKLAVDRCPYEHDPDRIRDDAELQGFTTHDVHEILYFSVDDEGIRSKYYREFEDLRKDLEASPFRHHALYIVFFDANMRRFGSRVHKGEVPDIT